MVDCDQGRKGATLKVLAATSFTILQPGSAAESCHTGSPAVLAARLNFFCSFRTFLSGPLESSYSIVAIKDDGENIAANALLLNTPLPSPG